MIKEQVIRNVIQCQQLWLFNERGEPLTKSVFFNARTGEFAAVASDSSLDAKNWLQVHFQSTPSQPHFYLANTEGLSISMTQLDGMMAEILKETLRALEELVQAHFRSDLPYVYPFMERQEVEEALKGKQAGTYLIHAPDATLQTIAQSLSEANQMIVIPFVLTLLEEEKQPVQYLVIATKRGWTILQDLPDLSSKIYQYYPNFASLLASLFPRETHSLN